MSIDAVATHIETAYSQLLAQLDCNPSTIFDLEAIAEDVQAGGDLREACQRNQHTLSHKLADTLGLLD